MQNSGIPLLGTLVLVLGTLAAAPGAGAAGAGAAPAGTIRLAQADGGVRSASVPLDGLRTGVLRSTRFSMVGLTWRGEEPRAELRTRAVAGRWGAWRTVQPMHDEAEADERRSAVRGSDLMWTGPSDRVQVRPASARSGKPRRVRLVLIDPGRRAADQRPPATPAAPNASVVAASGARVAARTKATAAPRPTLHGRKAWSANEGWRHGSPTYNTGLSQVHVHHSATGNGYAKADVPGIVRGMYSYHTKSLGWSDLGYNFLVDRFGRAWVGRAGGAARPVRGAHTLGFNHNSVGIAMIGNYASAAPTKKSLRAVANIAAWKLDKHGRPRATGKVGVRSTGSDRFAAGVKVRLPVVDGHRDSNETACPGELLYQRLPWIRRVAQKRMTRFS
ncbi:peptidoglycan recognition protein family protein [Nocardioides pantholopis]|uniref:peptidoglycan recognition protein family protein n=1 Tax=Nocardioides pantholopis TaxID=2483798 RepID=UPI000FDA4C49|nr:N-acetylmuramoyl-L-alanine amidase [Nocardioides pantholopis]